MPVPILCSACPSRCPTATSTSSYPYTLGPYVFGTGPSPSRLLFLGAGPGKTESETLRAYSGLAGKELDHTYLSMAGLYREEVHIDNLTKCWDGTDRTPPDKRVQSCARHHLPTLLASVRPEVVVLMGGAAVRTIDPLPHGQRVRLEMHHGMPVRGSILGGLWDGWIWPSYEPALGMRETTRMTALLEDFRRLGQWVRGEWEPPAGWQESSESPELSDSLESSKSSESSKSAKSLKSLDYRLVSDTDESAREFERYLYYGANTGIDNADPDMYWLRRPGVDTESHAGTPWSVQISVGIHAARVVKASNKRGLEAVRRWGDNALRNGLSLEYVLHNANGDLDTLDRMGIHPGQHFSGYRDTMQEAFQLCSLPQGLKPLVYRLLGVTMRSWEDVVWPASVQAVERWLESAQLLAERELVDVEIGAYVRGKCPVCGHQHTKGVCKRDGCGCEESFDENTWKEKRMAVPSTLAAILKHIRRYTVETKDADKPYNPWNALKRMRVEGLRGKRAEEWEWVMVESEVGQVPLLGIGNCTDEEAIRYAADDAARTGEVAVALEKMRGGERWRVDPGDIDAAA